MIRAVSTQSPLQSALRYGSPQSPLQSRSLQSLHTRLVRQTLPCAPLKSTIWMPGINLRDDTRAMDDSMAQPVLGVFYWLPCVLPPREPWFWVVPRHSTAWLYLFPYKRLRRSTNEISKGNVLSYYRNLGSLRYGTSTAFLAVLWAALLSRFLWRNLRCGGKVTAYIARRPAYFGGLWRAA